MKESGAIAGILIASLFCILFIIGIVLVAINRNKNRNSGETAEYIEPIGERSKWIAALLAFFVGGLGVHMFYLGHKKAGILRLISAFVLPIGIICLVYGNINKGLLVISTPCLIFWEIMSICCVVDFFCILTDTLVPADGMPYRESLPRRVYTTSACDCVDAIAKLASLCNHGVITNEEFQQIKYDLLMRI